MEVLQHGILVFAFLALVFLVRCVSDLVRGREVPLEPGAPEAIRLAMRWSPLIGILWALWVLFLVVRFYQDNW